MATFRHALTVEPMNRRSKVELATTLREQGRVDEAETVYRAILRDEPGAWQGLAGLGLCARLRRDLAAAAEHLGAALAAAPAPPERWLRQAFAGTLREQGRVDEAEAVYRALMCDEPGAWHGLVGLG